MRLNGLAQMYINRDISLHTTLSLTSLQRDIIALISINSPTLHGGELTQQMMYGFYVPSKFVLMYDQLEICINVCF